MAEPAPIYDPDQKKPVTRPNLKVIEGGGETSPPTGKLSTAPGSGASGQDPQKVGRGYVLTSPANRGLVTRALANRRRTFIVGGATAIISLVIVFFSFILPSLKLPHLQAHLGKRLARSAQTFTRNVTSLTAEKVAVDLTTDAEAKSLLSKSFLGKALNLYDPKAAVRTMKANGSLDFEYDAKGKISGVLIDGQRVPAPELDFGKFITNRSKWKTFYKDIYTQTDRALLRDGQSYLVRSRVSKAMVSSFGGKLYFWQRKGFDEKGKTPKQVTQDTQLQLFDDISTPPSQTALTNEVDLTAKDALVDERTCLSDATCAEKVSSGQLSLLEASGANKKISSFVSKYNEMASPTSKYGLAAGTIYGVGSIVCMAYDGSVETSKAVVDAQNSAAVRAYLTLASAADQQKKGGVTSEAVNGLNNLLGDISNTNPEKLARGQSIDTSFEPYSQSTRLQSYNVFGSGTAADTAAGFANYICPKILSTELLMTFGAWQFGSLLIPGLGSVIKNVGEKAATESVKIIVEQSFKRMFANITARFKGPVERKLLTNSALKFGVTNVAAAGASESLTYAARMVVLSQMGAFINGTDYNNLVNQADMGAVSYNSELDRQQNFGRPLTNQEVALTQVRDKQYLAAQRSHQSIFERYFAISNPDSSLANAVVNTQGFFAKFHSLSAIIGELPKLFLGMARSFAGIFIPQARVAAASATNTSDYNILQWGWSNDENNLIDNDPTYSDPLVNADILANSAEPGQVDQIAKTYGPCFSESMGTLLTTKPSGSDNFYVSRNQDTGDVTNDGLCSPASLGFDNTSDPLASDKDSRSNHKHDMIFRWRLNQGYQNAMNELTDIQNVQNTPAAAPAAPAAPIPPTTSCGDTNQPDWARTCSSTNPIVATDWYCNKTLGLLAAPQFKCPADFPASQQVPGQHSGIMLFNYRANGNHTRQAMLYLPSNTITQFQASPKQQTSAVPLIIYLHGRGEDTYGGPGKESLDGYWAAKPAAGDSSPHNLEKTYAMAQKYGAIVVDPQGQGKVLGDPSYGWSGQIDDLVKLPDTVSQMLPWVNIDKSRIYVMGSSMGGQEALLLTAQHPELIAAAYVNDPVTDLAAHHDNLLDPSSTAYRDHNVATAAMEPEVGGTPAQVKSAYDSRSPINTIPPKSGNNSILTKPIRLDIDLDDTLVKLSQKIDYYNAIKGANSTAPIYKYTCALEHAYILAVTPTGYDNAFSFFNNGGNWLTLNGNQQITQGSINCSR